MKRYLCRQESFRLRVSAVLLAVTISVLSGCGSKSNDASAQNTAGSMESTRRTEFESIPDDSTANAVEAASTSDSEESTGTDFATEVSENSESEQLEPIELQVGSLTVEIPGYYKLSNESGSDGELDNSYLYEYGQSGAMLEIATFSANGVGKAQFRDAKDEITQTVLDSLLNGENVEVTKSAETEYMGMPGYSYDFTAKADGNSGIGDLDFFLDEDADKIEIFLFLKINDPPRDVSTDYGNMMKNAAWSGTEQTEIAKSADSTSDDTESQTQSADGVDPDLKATLDSYENLMNDYCDFMEKYKKADSSDAVSMLSDYYEILNEYTEAMDKLDKLDTDNMSTADYQYYIDVTSRVSKRLLEVGQ